MQCDRLFVLKALMKVFALQHLGDGSLGRQFDPVCRFHLFEPLVVEANFGRAGRENLIDLLHVGLGVLHQFVGTERRARRGAARGVSDHSRKVADQENHMMTEVLKMFELAQKDRVSKVKVGRGRVEPGFHAQRGARSTGLLQLLAKLRLLHDFRGALLDVGQLLVNGSEIGHEGNYKECRRKRSECRIETAGIHRRVTLVL